MGLFVDKGSGCGTGIFPDPDQVDPKDRIRPDPDPQHWLRVCLESFHGDNICSGYIYESRQVGFIFYIRFNPGDV